jgi:DNA-binding protein YbaB
MFNLGQVGSKGAAAAKLMMLQRKIAAKKMEVEKDGIKVIVTGDGKVKRIEVDGEELKNVSGVINEAITSAQKWAAGEMQGMMGDISKIFK